MHSKTQKRIDSLQTHRAFAFLGIFSAHCGVSSLGACCVSIFLILSGFVMIYSYKGRILDESIKGSIRFAIKKINKLYPLHVLLMLVVVKNTVMALWPDFHLGEGFLLVGEIVLHATLLQAWVPSSQIYFSLNSVSWYLSTIFFIYSCFPKIKKRIERIDIRTSVCIAIVTYSIQIAVGIITRANSIQLPYFDNFSKWTTYIFPVFRMGDFLIGCCLGKIFSQVEIQYKEFRITKEIATILELFTVFVLISVQIIYTSGIKVFGEEWFRYTMLYTPCSILIVYLFAINRGRIVRMLNFPILIYIGDISAYTFLIHQIILIYFDRLVATIHAVYGYEINQWISYAGAFFVTIICAEMYRRTYDLLNKRWMNSKGDKMIGC